MHTGHFVHKYTTSVCCFCVWSSVPLPPTTTSHTSLCFSYAFSPSTFHMQIHVYTRRAHAQKEGRTRLGEQQSSAQRLHTQMAAENFTCELRLDSKHEFCTTD